MRFLVDHSKRFVLGWSAKCGCTHLKKLWYFLQGQENHPVHVRSEYVNFRIASVPKKYTYFIVGRNPFERLVSGFLEKYSQPVYCSKWVLNTGGLLLTFENFVNQLIKENWKAVDKHHFGPQLSEQWLPVIARYPNVQVCDIASVDYAFLEKAFDREIPNRIRDFRGEHVNTKPRRDFTDTTAYTLPIAQFTDFIPLVKNFYNRAIYDSVAQYFKSDLEFFKTRGIVYDLKMD